MCVLPQAVTRSDSSERSMSGRSFGGERRCRGLSPRTTRGHRTFPRLHKGHPAASTTATETTPTQPPSPAVARAFSEGSPGGRLGGTGAYKFRFFAMPYSHVYVVHYLPHLGRPRASGVPDCRQRTKGEEGCLSHRNSLYCGLHPFFPDMSSPLLPSMRECGALVDGEAARCKVAGV